MTKRLCALMVLWGLTAAWAELPPSVYEKKQAEAPEKLQIEIIRVEVTPGSQPETQTVRAMATVNSVDRTATGVREGDFIAIVYTVTEHPPGWVGPGAVPILREKAQTVAYLQKASDSRDYEPAAGAMSFRHF